MRSRLALAVALVVTLVACSAEQTELPFIDTFNRTNTDLGLGEGWDLRGPYEETFPLPSAADGFIKGGRYSYAGNSVVYAARQFQGTVRRMGIEGRWRYVGDGAETTMAMAITPNEQLITDMVHFTATRASWDLTLRRGGGEFEPVLNGRFSPALELGREYQFEFEANNDSVTVRVPGLTVSKDVSTNGLTGDRAFWEQYPNSSPAGTVFDADSVWAGGQ
ncbi:hypothetical protein [Mycobacterium sp. C31M]